jgi:TorA maturation chaperone TorD
MEKSISVPNVETLMTHDISRLNQSERSVFLNGLALMSQIFWGPTRETCADMMHPQFLLELAELSQLLPGPGSEAAVSLADCLDKHNGPAELFTHLEESYVPLFVSHREGICAPLYQSCYESDEGLLMGRPATMMSRRLDAAGLSLEGRCGEPLDHLAVEVEYCVLLLEKAFVATVPGSAFGQEGFLRLSYSGPTDEIKESAARIRWVLDPEASDEINIGGKTLKRDWEVT